MQNILIYIVITFHVPQFRITAKFLNFFYNYDKNIILFNIYKYKDIINSLVKFHHFCFILLNQ